ncbi:MAG TPA: cob(I)yrinic acid a,c-diamide adenosyltransferase [Candidatus Kapabacteria bacterium]|nr:cob(I)yrinic acid a,c-diamide adenosyltransferase [Candidatus Kapabacteria bacterium]
MATKIYTKTGDDGSTGLFGGGRVPKDSARIEAYGNVDELDSVIGLCAAASSFDWLTDLLHSIQEKLFILGADLATPIKGEGGTGEDARATNATRYNIPRIEEADATQLEHAIDEQVAALPPLKHFILPGGSELAARLHLARTVCRRAERSLVHLAALETIGRHDVIFLNRLSDLLFVLARRANQLAGINDIEWNGKKS